MLRIAGLFLLFTSLLPAANPRLLVHRWDAHWIRVAGANPFCYGVYHFRRTFELRSKPASFLVHVTADNRYQLYVNGTRVVWGPARGDLFHWRYESVDIAPYLHRGKNALAAVVWNDGRYHAVAQISHETGFLLQADQRAHWVVNTGRYWVGIQDPAYRPNPVVRGEVFGYVAVPPTERIDGRRYPWGWQQTEFDDSAWKPVEVGEPGCPRQTRDSPSYWFLVPRPIPLPELKPIRLARLRRASGVTPPPAWPAKVAAFTIPAHTTAKLLLDQDHLTTAYPELVTSGGRGAEISLGYAEALWIKGKHLKGNRNVVRGKRFAGTHDVFIADGGRHRHWRPLYWRTWRYLQMDIRTQEEPLRIDDLHAVFTGYPFQRKARFDAGRPDLEKILDVGWRTARLCAHETYMDCPYYEQLQYAGDTRIQAMVSLYMSGDARLMRNAINQLNSSRTPEGATFSRAPSSLPQYIPPFSLWWIGMVHDYWRYVDDPAFVKEMLPGVRAVLWFFAAHQKRDESLGHMPWWNFADWVPSWPHGVPPATADGSSAVLDLQLLLAYQWAGEMEHALGLEPLARLDQQHAQKLKATIQELYWDAGRGLYADTPRHQRFSQHANALAVLAGVVTGRAATQLMERTLGEGSLARATIYFRYYLNRAMAQAGLGDRYLDSLGPWRTMLASGLTTWAETDGPRPRSDCHAWGASPNIEFFRTVLGVDSAAPGFRRVLIAPHPGKLRQVAGVVPHPEGEISVALEQRGKAGLKADVKLPAGLTGTFQWHGRSHPLAAGDNHLVF